jgi:hypothetical protein
LNTKVKSQFSFECKRRFGVRACVLSNYISDHALELERHFMIALLVSGIGCIARHQVNYQPAQCRLPQVTICLFHVTIGELQYILTSLTVVSAAAIEITSYAI